MVLYPIGSTSACSICAGILQKNGITVVDHPTPDIDCLLLDVPGFSADGTLRGGGRIEEILPMLPEQLLVIGGKLDHPALQSYRRMDLLKEESYLARNAAITADCAIKVMAPKIDFVFQDCPVLILGWGRIGKCLAQMLRALGCRVTVAARKEADRAMLDALGYGAADFLQVPILLPNVRIVFNTVPKKILDIPVPGHCIGVELSSADGIYGNHLVIARGLPGKYAPESAGKLMAETILRRIREGTL